MKRLIDQPLNAQEKDFATENERLIYKFLYSKKLNIEEFYGLVAIGYLRAVKQYLRKLETQNKCSFSTYAFMQMSSEMSHYYSDRNAKKRQADLHSISTEDLPYDLIGEEIHLLGPVINSALLQQVLKHLNPKQIKMAQMIADGYTHSEIGQYFGITGSAVWGHMNEARKKLKRYGLCANEIA